ncbi:MAG: helix-turn-helix domain-containing protein [Blautia caecimuris]|uniref:helix-turn-helix domain-containing protein n=1 Tax=Blautia caecimuris TaxID=1796615 RepID=UPI0034B8F92C
MDIKNNDDLKIAVLKAIDDSGYKKSFIADKMGISRQAFSNFLNKSNFSLDDANKILNVINMYSNTVIHKKD